MEKKITIYFEEDLANELEKADYDKNSIEEAMLKAAQMGIVNEPVNKMWLDAYLDASAKFNSLKNIITDTVAKPYAAKEWGIDIDFSKVSWNLSYSTREFTITYNG